MRIKNPLSSEKKQRRRTSLEKMTEKENARERRERKGNGKNEWKPDPSSFIRILNFQSGSKSFLKLPAQTSDQNFLNLPLVSFRNYRKRLVIVIFY